MTPETRHMAMDHGQVAPAERWQFWHDWGGCTVRPSSQLECLRRSGQLHHYPELHAMIDVPQDPEWHPEGDTWIHTLHVCDAAAEIALREQLDEHDRLVLMFSALCHDLGKPATTEFRDGRWRAHGHPEAGVPIARRFLDRIVCPADLVAKVLPLVAEHLVHANPLSTDQSVRRFLRRLVPATIRDLQRLIEADMRGRPPLSGDVPEAVRRFLCRAESTSQDPKPVAEPRQKALISGQHLIDLGLKPGPLFRELLKAVEDAAARGEVTCDREAWEFVRRFADLDPPRHVEENPASSQTFPHCRSANSAAFGSDCTEREAFDS
ncbi:MAG: HD domain-containing protein [Planctomycetota bacterium]